MKLQLVEDWKFTLGKWSARLNALGLAIMAYLWFDPTPVLYVIQLTPLTVRRMLPDNVEAGVSALFFGLALISKLVKQPKLQAKIAAKIEAKKAASDGLA